MPYPEDYIRKWDMERKDVAKRAVVRRKIVNLFDRVTLEKLSGMPSPWLADTATLKQTVIIRWPATMLAIEVQRLLDKAI